MKKLFAIVIAVLMLVTAAVSVCAEEAVPEDYLVYMIEGMQRVRITSSYCTTFGIDADTSLIVDHRTGTGLTFDFTDKEDKTVSIVFASRDKELIEKAALIVEHDENTVVEVFLYVTSDPEQNVWMPVSNSNDSEDGDWKILKIDGLENGFAFYRFDFKVIEGDVFEIKELGLFRTAETEADAKPVDKSTLPLFEREQWRKAKALSRGFRK